MLLFMISLISVAASPPRFLFTATANDSAPGQNEFQTVNFHCVRTLTTATCPHSAAAWPPAALRRYGGTAALPGSTGQGSNVTPASLHKPPDEAKHTRRITCSATARQRLLTMWEYRSCSVLKTEDEEEKTRCHAWCCE